MADEMGGMARALLCVLGREAWFIVTMGRFRFK